MLRKEATATLYSLLPYHRKPAKSMVLRNKKPRSDAELEINGVDEI
jgi:hypothetical protein